MVLVLSLDSLYFINKINSRSMYSLLCNAADWFSMKMSVLWMFMGAVLVTTVSIISGIVISRYRCMKQGEISFSYCKHYIPCYIIDDYTVSGKRHAWLFLKLIHNEQCYFVLLLSFVLHTILYPQ